MAILLHVLVFLVLILLLILAILRVKHWLLIRELQHAKRLRCEANLRDETVEK